MNPLVQAFEKKQMKAKVPHFNVGDTVKVHVKIKEGEKERIQMFEGTVIGRKGAGISESFTVRRVAHGGSSERVFPIHSPNIGAIDILKQGRVRRAKLNYLRDKFGKAAKVASQVGPRSRQDHSSEESTSGDAAE